MGPEESSEYEAPLTSVDLRHNRLKGSIILGNYEVSIYLRFKLFLLYSCNSESLKEKLPFLISCDEFFYLLKLYP